MGRKITNEELANLRSIIAAASGDNLDRNHLELSSLILPLTNALPLLLDEVAEARELIQEVDHVYDWLLRGSPACGCGDCRQCWGDATAERTRQYLKELEPPLKLLIKTGNTEFFHDGRNLVIKQRGQTITVERSDIPEGLAALIFVATKEQVSGADIKKHCATLDVSPDYLKDLPF